MITPSVEPPLAPDGARPLVRAAPEILAAAAGLALVARNPGIWPDGGLLVDAGMGLALLLAARIGRLVFPRGGLLALAAGLLALTSALADDRGAAVVATLHALRVVAAFALGCTLAARSGGRSRVAWTLAAGTAAAAAHAALQLLVLHPRLLRDAAALPPGVVAQLADRRPNSIFLLPAHLGSAAAIGFVLACGLALGATTTARRVLAGALAAVSLVATAMAGSFGGILLAALGAAGLALFVASPRLWRILVLAALAGCALLVAVSLMRRHGEIARESPWTARARNWAAARVLVRESPLFGHGPGSFGDGHGRVRSAESNDVQHAHEEYLEAASDSGVLMLVVLAAFAGASLARLLRGAASGPLAAACGVAAMLAMAQGLIDFGWNRPEWALPGAVVLGLAWTIPGARADVAWGIPRVVVASLGLALVLSWDAAAAVSGASVEQALDEAAEGRHAEARARLELAARLMPLDEHAWSDLAASEIELARAEPDPQRRAELVGAAVEHARRAVRCSPLKAAAHGSLARALTAQGDVVGAAIEASRAAELAPRSADWARVRDEALRAAGLGAAP